MARFKASSSSSGFVSVSVAVLILLALIINIYPAAAADESLEAVEEVAKDQGTKDVASAHHHEIRGRTLINSGSFSKIFEKFINKHGKKISEAIGNANNFIPPSSP